MCACGKEDIWRNSQKRVFRNSKFHYVILFNIQKNNVWSFPFCPTPVLPSLQMADLLQFSLHQHYFFLLLLARAPPNTQTIRISTSPSLHNTVFLLFIFNLLNVNYPIHSIDSLVIQLRKCASNGKCFFLPKISF